MNLSNDSTRVASFVQHHCWLIAPPSAGLGLLDCGGSHEYWIDENIDLLDGMGLDWVGNGADAIEAGWAAITMMGNAISLAATQITQRYFTLFHDVVMAQVRAGQPLHRVSVLEGQVEGSNKEWTISPREFIALSNLSQLKRLPSGEFRMPNSR